MIYKPTCLFTLHVPDLSLALDITTVQDHLSHLLKIYEEQTHRLFIKHSLTRKRHNVSHLRRIFALKSLQWD